VLSGLKEDLRFRRRFRLILLPKSLDSTGINFGIGTKIGLVGAGL
jgi:hypothetical protein